MAKKNRRRQVNNNRFAEIPAPKLNRSMFKRQFGNKTTFNEGELIPVHVDEVYAGDTLQGKTTMFIRFTTPITPVMDNVDLDLHAFFVPYRLVWSNYYKMLGEQVNPGDSTNFIVPQIIQAGSTQFAQDSLADYFGLPTKVTIPQEDMPIALPFRAYNLIWNEWFRDENLQDSLVVKTDDTDDDISLYSVQRRNKKHDYFTSCLPFAQKGDVVNLPLGTEAPLIFPNSSGSLSVSGTTSNDTNWTRGVGGLRTSSGSAIPNLANTSLSSGAINHNHTLSTSIDISSTLSDSYADISSASAITVNALREAVSVQHILERRARGGTRDVEILQNTYGVSPADSRLQRPELIGASRAKLNLQTVAQTSATSGNSPLGNLSAVGTITTNFRFNYSAVENGVIIILASARADLTYWQGMPKMWSKRTFLDIMDPLRSNLGEQPVLRKELLMTDDEEYNNEVFGYLPNYDDLRFGRSQLTGRFRPNASDNLDIWHFAEEFSTNPGERPVLSGEFIKQNSPVKRTLALQDYPDFFGDVYSMIKTYRVIPTYSIPGLRRF